MNLRIPNLFKIIKNKIVAKKNDVIVKREAAIIKEKRITGGGISIHRKFSTYKRKTLEKSRFGTFSKLNKF